MAVKRYDGSQWVTVAGKGDQGTSSSISTWVKTATGGETSVSGNDDNSQPLSYTVGQELVFINGALQKRGADYTATTGNSITGLTALAANDVVTVWTVNAFSVTGAIANSIVDAKGDLIVATGADTPGILTAGTTGQVLTVDSTTGTGLKWAAPANGWTELASANLPTNSGTVTISAISGDYRQLVLIVRDFHFATDSFNLLVRYNSDTGSNYSQIELTATGASTLTSSFYNASGHYVTGHGLDNTAGENLAILTLTDYANTTTYKVAEAVSFAKDDGGAYWGVSKYSSGWLNTAAISSITITNTGAPANFSAGSYVLYGVK